MNATNVISAATFIIGLLCIAVILWGLSVKIVLRNLFPITIKRLKIKGHEYFLAFIIIIATLYMIVNAVVVIIGFTKSFIL